MDEIKTTTPKSQQRLDTHLRALQDVHHGLMLQLKRAEYMENSFVKEDLIPKLKELIIQTAELTVVSQLESRS